MADVDAVIAANDAAAQLQRRDDAYDLLDQAHALVGRAMTVLGEGEGCRLDGIRDDLLAVMNDLELT